MKLILIVSVILVLFALIFPVVAAYTPPDREEPDVSGDLSSTPFYVPNTTDAGDGERTVRFLDQGEVREISLSDYLIGAVAAEMPASFEPEALKAQAVALRTYLLHKLLVNPSAAHPEADICSDSSCCAAWRDEEALRAKWGEDFDGYMAKVTAAVTATDGQAIVYEGEPALAVFHSSSAGFTEDSGEVWAKSLPYLVSVASPEDAGTVPNFVSSVSVTAGEFQETVLSQFPEAVFSEDPADWIREMTLSGSGRLHSLVIGGVTVTGAELRSLFGLRSTAVTIGIDEDTVTMTATGYGHGVGMSQYGANAMAETGADYAEILANYYPGTELIFMSA